MAAISGSLRYIRVFISFCVIIYLRTIFYNNIVGMFTSSVRIIVILTLIVFSVTCYGFYFKVNDCLYIFKVRLLRYVRYMFCNLHYVCTKLC